MKFSKDGKFIKAWGKTRLGARRDSTSRTASRWIRAGGCSSPIAATAASRSSIRTGKFLDQWKQFGRPSGIFIDKNDTIYVADSQSNATQNPGFTRGIRIGSAKDGKVTAFIPVLEPDPEKNNNAGVEGVAADAKGNVYAAEVTTMALKKYVRK